MGSIDKLTVTEFSVPKEEAKAIVNERMDLCSCSSVVADGLDDSSDDDEPPPFSFDFRGKQVGQTAGNTTKTLRTIRPEKKLQVKTLDKEEADALALREKAEAEAKAMKQNQ